MEKRELRAQSSELSSELRLVIEVVVLEYTRVAGILSIASIHTTWCSTTLARVCMLLARIGS